MTTASKVEVFFGRGLAPGVGSGWSLPVGPPVSSFIRLQIPKSEVEAELERFRRAVESVRRQYEADRDKLLTLLGADHAAVIEAHLVMLGDRELKQEVEQRIREWHETAESALQRVAQRWNEAYHALKDEFFQERRFDFQDVIDRLAAELASLPPMTHEIPDTPELVLVAAKIPLAELARLEIDRIKGLVTQDAGYTSHLAIIARSLGIPLVSGICDPERTCPRGSFLVVDGEGGRIWVGESREKVELPARNILRRTHLRAVERPGPCHTRDGIRVDLFANLELPEEGERALRLGAEGVGLFRSEFLYLTKAVEPGDEAFFASLYDRLVRPLGEAEVVIRTLDVSGPQGEASAGEESGALGMRGIRTALRDLDQFVAQVRPIVRLRKERNVKIVLPMVSDVDELRQAKDCIQEIERQEGLPPDRRTPIGVLLEVPATLITLEAVAAESDFLEVGTNDLTQYILAVGRRSDQLADLYDPLHPAMLRALDHIVRIARESGRTVTVCGEMAGEPRSALLLVGMGYRRLSMGPYSLPAIREALSLYDLTELEAWVTELMQLASPSAVRRYLADRVDADLRRRSKAAQVR